MVTLDLRNKKPLARVGRRGVYTEVQKKELLSIPSDANLTLELKSLASKWGRDYLRVRSQYYALKNMYKESTTSTTTIPKRTVEEVSKNNAIVNAWTDYENDLLIQAMKDSDNRKQSATELSEIIDRTPSAIMARWRYIQDKETTSKVVESSEQFIPTPIENRFLNEVTTTAYESLDGEFHFNKQQAIKCNVRHILDSMPDKDAEDFEMHLWFFENKEKIEYLMNINPNELW